MNVSDQPQIRPKRIPPKNGVKFKPGQPGNPGGRPKKKPVTELYEKLLNDPNVMQMLEGSLKQMLRKGNMATVLHLREMTDRVEGKVTQPIEANVSMNLADAIAAARKRAGK